MIESVVESFYDNLIAEDRYRMILDGLQVTLLITLCAALLGTLLGGLVCWMRMSRRQWLQQVAKVYIELMRGTPVLVLLMLMYYGNHGDRFLILPAIYVEVGRWPSPIITC